MCRQFQKFASSDRFGPNFFVMAHLVTGLPLIVNRHDLLLKSHFHLHYLIFDLNLLFWFHLEPIQSIKWLHWAPLIYQQSLPRDQNS